MKLYFIIILALFIPELSSSKNLTIVGKIKDHKTNEPIAFANIAIEGSYYGTVSNDNGEFRLVIPDKLSNKSITFNSIGYSSFTIPISNITSYLDVFLKTINSPIDEVVIMPDSSLQALLRKAYNKIAENYPDYPTRTIGFYRESLKQEDGDYLNLSEAILDCYKTSYENESQGQVKIVRSRKNKLTGGDTINQVHFYGGLFMPHTSDIVKNRSEILMPSKEYLYKLEGIEMYNGREVFCISFYPKKINKKGRIGKLFIDKKSLAYVKFDYRSNNKELKWMEEEQPLTFLSSKDERFVRCYELINNKYFLKSAIFIGKIFNKKTNYMLEMTDEYITTEIMVDSVKQIPYSEQVSYTTIIADVAEDYQLSDWKDYNVLEDDSINSFLLNNQKAESVLARVQQPSKSEKNDKLLKFISRFETGLTLVSYPVSVSSGDYALQISLPSGNKIGYHFNSAGENFSFQYEVALKYKLHRNWKLFLNQSENILSSEKSHCYNGGIEYLIPLKTYGKKIFLSANAGYGFLKFMKSMGTTDNETEFNFGGKKFDSKQIEAFRGINLNGIRLGSDLSFQISSFWYLKLFGGWQYNFNQTEKIRLEEKKGFFLGLKSAEENLSSEEIKFLKNGETISSSQFHFQNYFMGLGLKWSF
jgi:hypothetical protein